MELLDALQDFASIKQSHSRQDLLIHRNNNSLQNKFEELKFINEKIKASIIVLTGETKIDSSYPDSQFRMQNVSKRQSQGRRRRANLCVIENPGEET